MLCHAITNVLPWGPNEGLERIDSCLSRSGSTGFSLPWESYELEDDGEHFTKRAYRNFARDLLTALPTNASSYYLVADSTVDWHNWSDDGEWTGWANSVLQETFQTHVPHIPTIIDAVGGTGFVAGNGHHYYTRISNALRTGSANGDTTFVLMGGWNDVREGDARVKVACGSIQSIADVVSRYAGV